MDKVPLSFLAATGTVYVAGSAALLTSGRIPQAGSGGLLADSLLGTSGITGLLTLTKLGTTARTVTFPDAADTVAMLGVSNAFTGANTFTNAAGIIVRPAATQDGIQLLGRAGGTGSFQQIFATAALTASRTFTLPDAAMTITGGGTLALGGFTLTVPATGTAALLGTGNVFSATGNIFQQPLQVGVSSNTAIVNLVSSSNVTASVTFTTSSTLRGSWDSDSTSTRLVVNSVSTIVVNAAGTLAQIPISAVVGTTALLASERFRIAGGSAPPTPGATDVLFGDGQIFTGNTGEASLRANGGVTHSSTTLLTTSVNLGNGAAAQTATMTNGPTAGNPTKWVPINDNGTTRYIPAW